MNRAGTGKTFTIGIAKFAQEYRQFSRGANSGPARTSSVRHKQEGRGAWGAPARSAVHPAVDIDLVAFVLRDIEGITIRIEAAVLGHGPAARSPADAALGQ